MDTTVKNKKKVRKSKTVNREKFQLLDGIILFFLVLGAAAIVFPFISVLATSFATHREFLDARLLLWPQDPTLDNFFRLFQDLRIPIGFRTTLTFLLIGVPLNMFLTTSLAYGLSRTNFPGGKFFFYAVLITMLFNGGIVPLFLLHVQLGTINTIWSVILSWGVNTFYFIIMRTYFTTMPDSLIESAKLDGAGEYRILFNIILPLAKPILACIVLFYSVDRWNEWWFSMIFIRNPNIMPLQLVLRHIVIDSVMAHSVPMDDLPVFTGGIRMATVVLSIVPVMLFFPFLQKYFVKGIMIGAVKA